MSAEPQGLVEHSAQVLETVPKGLLVAGAWTDASTGDVLEVRDPSTGEVLCSVADAGSADAERALATADEFQSTFAESEPRARGEILRRAFELMIERREDLALLATLEMGKPLGEARAEVDYAAEFFRWFSEEAVRVAGDYRRSPSGSGRILSMSQPVGPALLITPWNFPLAMATRKVGPAIAAGCTMLLKPAAETPLSALAVAQILMESGLPPRALNVIVTSRPADVFEPLLGDPRPRKISFTGSTDVGRRLLAAAAPAVLRSSLELGGNAPFLIFPDADLDAAVEGALLAKLRNTGQSCTAANRFIVHTSQAAEFSERLAAEMSAKLVGRGTEPGVEVGPLINERACARLESSVEAARAEGAVLRAGGSASTGSGSYFPPTVLSDVSRSAAILREELFGPVATITTFEREAEAVAIANDTEHGLVSFLYTQQLNRALRVSEQLQSGMVGLNQGMVSNAAAPFGGVKSSGLGREGGFEGISEFLETKYVAISTPPEFVEPPAVEPA